MAEALLKPHYVAVVRTPHLFGTSFLSVHTYFTISQPCRTAAIRPPDDPLCPLRAPTETESRHGEDGLPHAVLVDGVDVRPAYRAHLALPRPWALAVAVALFHCTFTQLQWTAQGSVTCERRK